MGAREARPGLEKAIAALLAGALAFAGCSSEPQARPQLIVVVDTDAPLVGQLSSALDLPRALAIDTVRVDLVGDDREVTEFRDITAPDVRDWPLSFGIVSEPRGKSLVRLRIRAFRAAQATRGTLAGTTTIEPPPSSSIDRLVEIDLPVEGLQTVGLVLSTACMGAQPSFQPPLRTCVDDARRADNPRAGVEVAPAGATVAGRSAFVGATPCSADSPPTAACIPGGLGLIGDAELDGIVDSVSIAPSRPIVMTAFHMDTTEFTVGRYRTLLGARKVKEEPIAKAPGDALLKDCTWASASDGSQDEFPLNCISYAGAIAACKAVGGRLPTDAEWEYAARGRGLASRFPWGDAPPTCCTASVARVQLGVVFECTGNGVEPVMAHVDAPACSGTADVSRDGIFDLGGSLSEVTSDEGGSLRDACFDGPGLVLDPRCPTSEPAAGRFSRGGDWASGSFLSASALRRRGAMPSNTVGFRCVYDDGR